MKKLQITFIFIAILICSCSKEEAPDVIPDTIITPTVGVGNISFEDDGNKIINEYGMYERLTSVGTLSTTAFVMWYDDLGLGFQLDYLDTKDYTLQEIVSMSSELIDLNQNIITMVVMSPSKAKTEKGISLGSSRADVVAAYGEPSKINNFTETYDELKIHFSYSSTYTIHRIDLFR